jgi:antitoxin (DNA-binding transcriptional repressor) of toxin-antitoxin stability system
MHTVGIRELKNHLSRYVREAREGAVVRITDRGEVVAELRPPVPVHPLVARYPQLGEWAEQGRVRLGSPNRPELYERLPPLLAGITSAELLAQDRGER